jgi:predicted transcriptional regulator of viral defense system
MKRSQYGNLRGGLRHRDENLNGFAKFIAVTCQLWYIATMRFGDLLKIVGDEPVFETSLLLAGEVNPADVRRQLSRWTKAGRLYQLRRGLYALAPPFQKVRPHPFIIANRLMRGSYVSCQSALAHYGLIPEYVPVVTSVTAMRPMRWENPLGIFEFRHVKSTLLTNYRWIELSPGQKAFVATPEKALLDLVHLHRNADSPDYLRELRLQNLERMDLEELRKLSTDIDKPKLHRAAKLVADLAATEAQDYETL